MSHSSVPKMVAFALLAVMPTEAFSPQAYVTPTKHHHQPLRTLTLTTLEMAKKKGFGKETAPAKKSKPATDELMSSEPVSTATAISTPDESPLNKNAGKDALARLRQQKVEARNEELRSIRDLKNVDRQLSEAPDSAVIPEKVAQRMGARMLPFVGIPLFGVMAAFVTFWYLATYKNYEFQPALVAFTTIAIMGAGLLGITYSVMSASWDEDEDGSALGVDEFKKNFGSIQDGLKRTRDNAILREKMSSISEQEIDAALKDLDRKEQADKAKKLTLEEKLQKDLE